LGLIGVYYWGFLFLLLVVGCFLFPHFPTIFGDSQFKDNNRIIITGVEGHFLVEFHRPGGHKSEGIDQKENQQRCD